MNLLCFKASLHRCTRIAAELWIQSINVEADIHLLRKIRNDVIANMLPGVSFKLTFLDILIEVGFYSLIRLDQFVFLITKIAYTHLNEFTHFRHFTKYIVHDGGVGIFKPFIGCAQIGMSIYL